MLCWFEREKSVIVVRRIGCCASRSPVDCEVTKENQMKAKTVITASTTAQLPLNSLTVGCLAIWMPVCVQEKKPRTLNRLG